ncbi:MAG: GNAT family N-acetyltransferase [Clostridia bacterium]|nr:GNAT family N-acetyltransferase [Clostridia bacterium]
MGVSTRLYGNLDAVSAVEALVRQGLRVVELTCDAPQLNPFLPDQAEVGRLCELRNRHDLMFSLHPPSKGINIASNDPADRLRSVEAYLSTLTLAARVDAMTVAVHCGHKSDPSMSCAEAVALAKSGLRVISERAVALGIRLTIENTASGTTSLLGSPEDAFDLLDACSPATSLALNAGNAVLQGFDAAECARLWMPRLGAVHAHDNGGQWDEHLALGRGIVDWDALLAVLRDADWRGLFMLQIWDPADPLRALADSLSVVGRSWTIVRPLLDDEQEWAERLLKDRWGSTRIVTRGRLVDAARLPALIAVSVDGRRLGLLTYEVRDGQYEIVSLDALRRGVGIGQQLIRGVLERAREAEASRVWLITTNDNTRALRFYQKAGFRIAAVHRDSVTEGRRLKPEIPLIGEEGIPIRDEIELEMMLDGGKGQ